MKIWAWLIPCWVWKYFFAQLPRQRVLLDGRSRFLIRLDEEFVLVYDPQEELILPRPHPCEPNHLGHPAGSYFRTFEMSSPGSSPMQRTKLLRNRGLHVHSGVGTQVD